jgi:hypothetical protein
MPRDLKDALEALKRAADEQPKPREYFQKPKLPERDPAAARDWSGASWAGEKWSGRDTGSGRGR